MIHALFAKTHHNTEIETDGIQFLYNCSLIYTD